MGKYSFFSNVHLKKEKKFKLKTTGSNPKLYWYRTFLWLSLRIWIKSTVFTLLVISYFLLPRCFCTVWTTGSWRPRQPESSRCQQTSSQLTRWVPRSSLVIHQASVATSWVRFLISQREELRNYLYKCPPSSWFNNSYRYLTEIIHL